LPFDSRHTAQGLNDKFAALHEQACARAIPRSEFAQRRDSIRIV